MTMGRKGQVGREKEEVGYLNWKWVWKDEVDGNGQGC